MMASVGCVDAGSDVTAVITDAMSVTVSVTFGPGLASTVIGVVMVCCPAGTVTEDAMVTMLPAPAPVKVNDTGVGAMGG